MSKFNLFVSGTWGRYRSAAVSSYRQLHFLLSIEQKVECRHYAELVFIVTCSPLQLTLVTTPVTSVSCVLAVLALYNIFHEWYFFSRSQGRPIPE